MSASSLAVLEIKKTGQEESGASAAAGTAKALAIAASDPDPATLLRCAEAALSCNDSATVRAALTAFFASQPPKNQFHVRALFLEAKLKAAEAGRTNGALFMMLQSEAIQIVLRAMDMIESIATIDSENFAGAATRSTVDNLRYNATVYHYDLIRPFLRAGFRRYAVPSLRLTVNLLNKSNDPDLRWRLLNTVCLAQCEAEAGEKPAYQAQVQALLQLLQRMDLKLEQNARLREEIFRLRLHLQTQSLPELSEALKKAEEVWSESFPGAVSLSSSSSAASAAAAAAAPAAGGKDAAKGKGAAATPAAAAPVAAAERTPQQALQEFRADIWRELQVILTATAPGQGLTGSSVVTSPRLKKETAPMTAGDKNAKAAKLAKVEAVLLELLGRMRPHLVTRYEQMRKERGAGSLVILGLGDSQKQAEGGTATAGAAPAAAAAAASPAGATAGGAAASPLAGLEGTTAFSAGTLDLLGHLAFAAASNGLSDLALVCLAGIRSDKSSSAASQAISDVVRCQLSLGCLSEEDMHFSLGHLLQAPSSLVDALLLARGSPSEKQEASRSGGSKLRRLSLALVQSAGIVPRLGSEGRVFLLPNDLPFFSTALPQPQPFSIARVLLRRRMEALKLLKGTVALAKRAGDAFLVEFVSTAIWNMSLPLLTAGNRHASVVVPAFDAAAGALEAVDSSNLSLRVRLHLESAKLYMASDLLAAALQQLRKALSIDCGDERLDPSYAEGDIAMSLSLPEGSQRARDSRVRVPEASRGDARETSLRRPLDKSMLPLLRTLVLRAAVYEEPQDSADAAVLVLEQCKSCKEATVAKTLLERACDHLDMAQTAAVKLQKARQEGKDRPPSSHPGSRNSRRGSSGGLTLGAAAAAIVATAAGHHQGAGGEEHPRLHVTHHYAGHPSGREHAAGQQNAAGLNPWDMLQEGYGQLPRAAEDVCELDMTGRLSMTSRAELEAHARLRQLHRMWLTVAEEGVRFSLPSLVFRASLQLQSQKWSPLADRDMLFGQARMDLLYASAAATAAAAFPLPKPSPSYHHPQQGRGQGQSAVGRGAPVAGKAGAAAGKKVEASAAGAAAVSAVPMEEAIEAATAQQRRRFYIASQMLTEEGSSERAGATSGSPSVGTTAAPAGSSGSSPATSAGAAPAHGKHWWEPRRNLAAQLAAQNTAENSGSGGADAAGSAVADADSMSSLAVRVAAGKEGGLLEEEITEIEDPSLPGGEPDPETGFARNRPGMPAQVLHTETGHRPGCKPFHSFNHRSLGTVLPGTPAPLYRLKIGIVVSLVRAAYRGVVLQSPWLVESSAARLWNLHLHIWQANDFGPAAMPLLIAGLQQALVCLAAVGSLHSALIGRIGTVIARAHEEAGRSAGINALLGVPQGSHPFLGIDGAVLAGLEGYECPSSEGGSGGGSAGGAAAAASHAGYDAAEDDGINDEDDPLAGERPKVRKVEINSPVMDRDILAAVLQPLQSQESCYKAAEGLCNSLLNLPLWLLPPSQRRDLLAIRARICISRALGHNVYGLIPLQSFARLLAALAGMSSKAGAGAGTAPAAAAPAAAGKGAPADKGKPVAAGAAAVPVAAPNALLSAITELHVPPQQLADKAKDPSLVLQTVNGSPLAPPIARSAALAAVLAQLQAQRHPLASYSDRLALLKVTVETLPLLKAELAAATEAICSRYTVAFPTNLSAEAAAAAAANAAATAAAPAPAAAGKGAAADKGKAPAKDAKGAALAPAAVAPAAVSPSSLSSSASSLPLPSSLLWGDASLLGLGLVAFSMSSSRYMDQREEQEAAALVVSAPTEASLGALRRELTRQHSALLSECWTRCAAAAYSLACESGIPRSIALAVKQMPRHSAGGGAAAAAGGGSVAIPTPASSSSSDAIAVAAISAAGAIAAGQWPLNMALLSDAQRCAAVALVAASLEAEEQEDQEAVLRRVEAGGLLGAPGFGYQDFGLPFPVGQLQRQQLLAGSKGGGGEGSSGGGGAGAKEDGTPSSEAISGGAAPAGSSMNHLLRELEHSSRFMLLADGSTVQGPSMGGVSSCYKWWIAALLLWAQCIAALVSPQMQSIIEQGNLRRSALNKVVQAARWAADVMDSSLLRSAVFLAFNVGLPLASSDVTRAYLALPYRAILNAVAAVPAPSKATLAVSAELYRLVLSVYVDLQQWQEGLQTAELAFARLPASFHDKLWSVRLVFQSKLGQDTTLAMAMLREDSPELRARLWLSLTRLAAEGKDQAAAYAAALEVLSGSFLRVYVLLDYAEWLQANRFSTALVRDAAHSAADMVSELIAEQKGEAAGGRRVGAGGRRGSTVGGGGGGGGDADDASSVYSESYAGSAATSPSNSPRRKSLAPGALKGTTSSRTGSVGRPGTRDTSKSRQTSAAGSTRRGTVTLGATGRGGGAGQIYSSSRRDWPSRLEVSHLELLLRATVLSATVAETASERAEQCLLAAQCVMEMWQLSVQSLNLQAAERAYFHLSDAERAAIPSYAAWLQEAIQSGPFSAPETAGGWLDLWASYLQHVRIGEGQLKLDFQQQQQKDKEAAEASSSGKKGAAAGASAAGEQQQLSPSQKLAASFASLRSALSKSLPGGLQPCAISREALRRPALTLELLQTALTYLALDPLAAAPGQTNLRSSLAAGLSSPFQQGVYDRSCGYEAFAAPLLACMLLLSADVAEIPFQPAVGLVFSLSAVWANRCNLKEASANLCAQLPRWLGLPERDRLAFQTEVALREQAGHVRRASQMLDRGGRGGGGGGGGGGPTLRLGNGGANAAEGQGGLSAFYASAEADALSSVDFIPVYRRELSDFHVAGTWLLLAELAASLGLTLGSKSLLREVERHSRVFTDSRTALQAAMLQSRILASEGSPRAAVEGLLSAMEAARAGAVAAGAATAASLATSSGTNRSQAEAAAALLTVSTRALPSGLWMRALLHLLSCLKTGDQLADMKELLTDSIEAFKTAARFRHRQLGGSHSMPGATVGGTGIGTGGSASLYSPAPTTSGDLDAAAASIACSLLLGEVHCEEAILFRTEGLPWRVSWQHAVTAFNEAEQLLESGGCEQGSIYSVLVPLARAVAMLRCPASPYHTAEPGLPTSTSAMETDTLLNESGDAGMAARYRQSLPPQRLRLYFLAEALAYLQRADKMCSVWEASCNAATGTCRQDFLPLPSRLSVHVKLLLGRTALELAAEDAAALLAAEKAFWKRLSHDPVAMYLFQTRDKTKESLFNLPGTLAALADVAASAANDRAPLTTPAFAAVLRVTAGSALIKLALYEDEGRQQSGQGEEEEQDSEGEGKAAEVGDRRLPPRLPSAATTASAAAAASMTLKKVRTRSLQTALWTPVLSAAVPAEEVAAAAAAAEAAAAAAAAQAAAAAAAPDKGGKGGKAAAPAPAPAAAKGAKPGAADAAAVPPSNLPPRVLVDPAKSIMPLLLQERERAEGGTGQDSSSSGSGSTAPATASPSPALPDALSRVAATFFGMQDAHSWPPESLIAASGAHPSCLEQLQRGYQLCLSGFSAGMAAQDWRSCARACESLMGCFGSGFPVQAALALAELQACSTSLKLQELFCRAAGSMNRQRMHMALLEESSAGFLHPDQLPASQAVLRYLRSESLAFRMMDCSTPIPSLLDRLQEGTRVLLLQPSECGRMLFAGVLCKTGKLVLQKEVQGTGDRPSSAKTTASQSAAAGASAAGAGVDEQSPSPPFNPPRVPKSPAGLTGMVACMKLTDRQMLQLVKLEADAKELRSTACSSSVRAYTEDNGSQGELRPEVATWLQQKVVQDRRAYQAALDAAAAAAESAISAEAPNAEAAAQLQTAVKEAAAAFQQSMAAAAAAAASRRPVSQQGRMDLLENTIQSLVSRMTELLWPLLHGTGSSAEGGQPGDSSASAAGEEGWATGRTEGGGPSSSSTASQLAPAGQALSVSSWLQGSGPVVICADRSLSYLPLEALPALRNSSCLTRDLSLQVLGHRLAASAALASDPLKCCIPVSPSTSTSAGAADAEAGKQQQQEQRLLQCHAHLAGVTFVADPKLQDIDTHAEAAASAAVAAAAAPVVPASGASEEAGATAAAGSGVSRTASATPSLAGKGATASASGAAGSSAASVGPAASVISESTQVKAAAAAVRPSALEGRTSRTVLESLDMLRLFPLPPPAPAVDPAAAAGGKAGAGKPAAPAVKPAAKGKDAPPAVPEVPLPPMPKLPELLSIEESSHLLLLLGKRAFYPPLMGSSNTRSSSSSSDGGTPAAAAADPSAPPPPPVKPLGKYWTGLRGDAAPSLAALPLPDSSKLLDASAAAAAAPAQLEAAEKERQLLKRRQALEKQVVSASSWQKLLMEVPLFQLNGGAGASTAVGAGAGAGAAASSATAASLLAPAGSYAGGGFIYYGPGRLLSYFSPEKLAGLLTPSIRFALLADMLATESSLRFQAQLENGYREQVGRAELEQGWETAALLTFMGVGVIAANQWPSSRLANEALLHGALGLAARKKLPLAQAVRELMQSTAEVPLSQRRMMHAAGSSHTGAGAAGGGDVSDAASDAGSSVLLYGSRPVTTSTIAPGAGGGGAGGALGASAALPLAERDMSGGRARGQREEAAAVDQLAAAAPAPMLTVPCLKDRVRFNTILYGVPYIGLLGADTM